MSAEHQHHLWNFLITGLGDFKIQVVGNPSLVHTGSMSTTTLFLTEAQAFEVEQVIKRIGHTVVRRRLAEQTPEQRDERLAVLGSEDTVFPCAVCPSCYWFDPTLAKGVCGRVGWPASSVQASFDAHEAARAADEACPVKPWSS